MYEVVPPNFYHIFQPDGPMHSGSEGWSQSPVPSWGENPAQRGPRSLGEVEELPPELYTEDEVRQSIIEEAVRNSLRDTKVQVELEDPLVAALKRVAKDTTFQAAPPPPPYAPYPVHREIPKTMFAETTGTSAAPWGIFPAGRAYGAYYSEPATRAVGAYYSEPATRAVGDGESPAAAAATGLAMTGGVLAALALVPLVLGGIGYWVGGKVAPSFQQKHTYQWAGAASNIIAPGIGLLALAMIGAAKSEPVKPNRRRRRRSHRRPR